MLLSHRPCPSDVLGPEIENSQEVGKTGSFPAARVAAIPKSSRLLVFLFHSPLRAGQRARSVLEDGRALRSVPAGRCAPARSRAGHRIAPGSPTGHERASISDPTIATFIAFLLWRLIARHGARCGLEGPRCNWERAAAGSMPRPCGASIGPPRRHVVDDAAWPWCECCL
jgi:hypothetical protein